MIFWSASLPYTELAHAGLTTCTEQKKKLYKSILSCQGHAICIIEFMKKRVSLLIGISFKTLKLGNPFSQT